LWLVAAFVAVAIPVDATPRRPLVLSWFPFPFRTHNLFVNNR
jgi:heme A synthase